MVGPWALGARPVPSDRIPQEVDQEVDEVQPPVVARAVAAATGIASSLGLAVDEVVQLNNSNKLTLRLLPCDTVARVAPWTDQVALFELELARRLAVVGAPVAPPDPRVEPRAHERDGFVVTFWTHYEPGPQREVPLADYADALARLHAGLRRVDGPAPHFTERVERAAEGQQLLHGEPHPGNLLPTPGGPLFIDFETCCRGPVEFDLAHAPAGVGEHYPGAGHALLHRCRALVLAMITTWRWDREDQLPDGRRLAAEWLDQLRAVLDRDGRDPNP